MNIHTAENYEAAQQIIKALALPTASGAPVAPRPVPLSHLPRLPSETSMGYGIGRVDPSGRVTSRGITDALRWRPGDLLTMALTPSAVVLCPSPDGLLRVPRRPCIAIPVTGPSAPQHHPRRRAAPRRGPRIPHRDRAHDAGHGRHARLVLRPDRGGRAFAAITSSHGTGWSDLDAARLLLEKLGVRPADLVAAPAVVEFPLIADYIPLVEKAVTKGTRRVYGPYWARVVREWGYRRVNEPTALEISQLAEQVRAGAVQRRNARGGRGAAEHLIGALLARRDPETQTISLVLDDTTANVALFAIAAHADEREAHIREVERSGQNLPEGSYGRRNRQAITARETRVAARLRAVEQAYRTATERGTASRPPEPTRTFRSPERQADREMELE